MAALGTLMEKLTDFKPLARVSLPGLGALQCSGLVVLVGPNSSGKSQFLHGEAVRDGFEAGLSCRTADVRAGDEPGRHDLWYQDFGAILASKMP
jgi:hypothetical protein